MLAISTLVFYLIAFYLDKVLPRQYGERLPLCFCFQKKHLCCCYCEANEANGASVFDDHNPTQEKDPFELKYIADETNYEPVPPEIA